MISDIVIDKKKKKITERKMRYRYYRIIEILCQCVWMCMCESICVRVCVRHTANRYVTVVLPRRFVRVEASVIRDRHRVYHYHYAKEKKGKKGKNMCRYNAYNTHLL